MKRGSVIVDVSIDQGGCVETSRPTTHSDPVYEVDGIIHYCVTNIPGIVPRTSTYALCNATIPYIRKVADLGVERALKDDQGLRQGMNIHRGGICHRSVAEAMNRPWTPYH
jgi:alanine dehydrogenase